MGQTELVPYTADYFFFRADRAVDSLSLTEEASCARGGAPMSWCASRARRRLCELMAHRELVLEGNWNMPMLLKPIVGLLLGSTFLSCHARQQRRIRGDRLYNDAVHFHIQDCQSRWTAPARRPQDDERSRLPQRVDGTAPPPWRTDPPPTATSRPSTIAQTDAQASLLQRDPGRPGGVGTNFSRCWKGIACASTPLMSAST